MIINQLKMVNFRQYKNENLTFSVEPDKNVTVIIGDNSHGKTTFVCAFIWCLYRELNLAGPILNSDVAKELNEGEETFTEVKLTLTHDNSRYIITTKQDFKMSRGKVDPISKPVTTIIKDDNSGAPARVISQPQQVGQEIEFILKKDLKNYFFYDGENNRIETIGKKVSLKTAINKMMGIDRVMDLVEIFKPSVTQSVHSKLNGLLVADNTPELVFHNSQLDDFRTKLDKLTNEKESNEAEIKKLEDQYYAKERILSANKDIGIDQSNKLKLKSLIKADQLKVDRYFESALRVFNGNTPSLLHSVLLAKNYKKFKLNDLPTQSSFSKEDSLSHINEQVIDQLIERGRCLCGAIITDSNDARKHLEEAREHMEPNDFGKHLNDFCIAMENHVDRKESLLDKLNDECTSFLDLIESIDKNEKEMKAISERIAGKPDIGEIQKQANDILVQKNGLEQINRRIETREIPDCELNISKEEEKIRKLVGVTGDNYLINKCIDYASVIYNEASSVVNEKQIEIRKELEDQVNDIFNSIYHGKRNVKINDEFVITTELLDGEELSASGGTETVKNFSFVSGLIRLVKRHLLSEGNSLFATEQDDKYPLVLDAPFSGVDEIHTQNVCKILPDYCDQVIMVLLKDDYEKAKETLEDRVGKMYSINKFSETCSQIKEEE